ncbi:3'-5' exonuclease [Nocardia otitidiscaviarum]|uniref:3'-5' exonuclease n=1 Tax=Nocardia otitidiscaviarum TaxID=1823 RepID=UPI0004A6E372|nr:hypothetical protein [Nocardia otitidiscaviarum]
MTHPPLVFLDTETDGVHPDRKVWEAAMIRRDDTGSRAVEFFIEIDLSTADPFGLKVGGFYDRHPLGRYLSGLDARASGSALRPSDAAHMIARWTHGAHIVGAVPNFDTEVLANLLRAHGLTPAWHYHLIDVESLAVGWLHRKAEPFPAGIPLPWKSDELSRACGVEPPTEDERHTAMGDARWAQRLYDRITGDAA